MKHCAFICCLYCFQVKHALHLECSEEQQFEWDILCKTQEVCKPEIGIYTLPRWAGTWKIMNFAFRQQKQEWDCIWPDYEQSRSDHCESVLQLDEEVGTGIILISVLIYLFIFFAGNSDT